jgi:lipoate-protein ligase A
MQKTATQKTTKDAFGDSTICFFGWDTLSAGKNMAVDEILLRRAEKENTFFVRFYDFSRPSVVLGSNDHPDLVKDPTGVDICRRITGGRPIYIDKNILGYSIIGPLTNETVELSNVEKMHKALGIMLAATISNIIGKEHEVTLGNTSSIRVDDKPIAGHAQHIIGKHSFIYSGVIVIAPWEIHPIKRLLGINSEDQKSISQLPNIADLAVEKKDPKEHKMDVVKGLSARFPRDNLTYIADAEKRRILSEATLLFNKKYGKADWTFKQDGFLRRDVKFCILFEDGPKPQPKN